MILAALLSNYPRIGERPDEQVLRRAIQRADRGEIFPAEVAAAEDAPSAGPELPAGASNLRSAWSCAAARSPGPQLPAGRAAAFRPGLFGAGEQVCYSLDGRVARRGGPRRGEGARW